MQILFNTAYGLLKNAKPFTDFPLLLEIQERNSLVIGENYRTHKYAQITSSCISKSIKQETVNLPHLFHRSQLEYFVADHYAHTNLDGLKL
jgi:hypothetical protein